MAEERVIRREEHEHHDHTYGDEGSGLGAILTTLLVLLLLGFLLWRFLPVNGTNRNLNTGNNSTPSTGQVNTGGDGYVQTQ